ncbi:MAG TPA: hypothetical protein V6C89_01105 [Drouetiella sp.]
MSHTSFSYTIGLEAKRDWCAVSTRPAGFRTGHLVVMDTISSRAMKVSTAFDGEITQRTKVPAPARVQMDRMAFQPDGPITQWEQDNFYKGEELP